MIEVSHLTKQYGNHLAVDDVSFTVAVFAVKLFSSDSTGGASTLASAAIDASVCIHNCNTILNGDSANGASALASAAANTCVRNLVCHNKTLLLSPVH